MAKNSEVPLVGLPEAENIKFSFEFYDTTGKYCLKNWGEENLSKTLARLQDICCKKLSEIMRDKRVYHFAPVDWSQTIEKTGFPNNKVNRLDPYHFSLVGVNNQKARVYGGYAGNIFYVVWFDLEHTIWPSFKKNT